MNYPTIKWIIFIALFITVPAMLFLVQAVMFMPAVFFIAGIIFMIPKAIITSHSQETLWFIAIIGVHVLLYTGIYYFFSFLIAKLISLIMSGIVKKIIVLVICSVLVGITFFPVYGGGGHGPVDWVTLPQFLSDINRSYGSAASAIVYGAVFLLVISCTLIKRYSNRKGLP
jgi:hypothetical protein